MNGVAFGDAPPANANSPSAIKRIRVRPSPWLLTSLANRTVYARSSNELCAKLQTFGALRTDAVKSSINLVAKHHFGGVHVLKDGLRVGFILSRPLKHPRILRMEPITATIYAHHVKVTHLED